jgi:hypothetical protein
MRVTAQITLHQSDYRYTTVQAVYEDYYVNLPTHNIKATVPTPPQTITIQL